MKALFLGLGGIGQRHLRNLRTLHPEARIAAVRYANRTFEITSDLKADHSVDLVAKYEIALYPSIADAIAGFVPDVAIVASPTSVHTSQTVELLRAGLPVLLEKPISADREDLDEIARLVGEGRGPVMVGYMLRFHPGVRRLKELLDAGILGRLYSARIVAHAYMPDWHSYEGVKDFYAGRRDLGGGTILTNIHLIDLMYWMLGLPERLWCLGGSLSPFDFDVEDSTATLFDYRIDGRPVPVSLHLSFVQRPPKNAITFHGERGSLSWDLTGGKVVLAATSPGASDEYDFSAFAWNDMFVAELKHFLDAVAEKTRPESDFESVRGGHLLALAMRDSLESGEPVRVT